MKTYNGTTISKKYIQSVLRTENRTEIFRLYHHIFGGKVERKNVYTFIREFAPSNRVYDAAYRLAHLNDKKLANGERYPGETRKSIRFREQNAKHIALVAFKEEIKRGLDNYSKRPMMGYTHLYFCSPFFGHADYNKWRVMPIKGNERFCELLCKLGDKYFPVPEK